MLPRVIRAGAIAFHAPAAAGRGRKDTVRIRWLGGTATTYVSESEVDRWAAQAERYVSDLDIVETRACQTTFPVWESMEAHWAPLAQIAESFGSEQALGHYVASFWYAGRIGAKAPRLYALARTYLRAVQESEGLRSFLAAGIVRGKPAETITRLHEAFGVEESALAEHWRQSKSWNDCVRQVCNLQDAASLPVEPLMHPQVCKAPDGEAWTIPRLAESVMSGDCTAWQASAVGAVIGRLLESASSEGGEEPTHEVPSDVRGVVRYGLLLQRQHNVPVAPALLRRAKRLTHLHVPESVVRAIHRRRPRPLEVDGGGKPTVDEVCYLLQGGIKGYRWAAETLQSD